MKRFTVLALAVVFCLAGLNAAKASFVTTYTASLPAESTGFDIGEYDVNGDFVGPFHLMIPQFDPALGTLTKVTLSVSQTVDAAYTVENLNSFSKTATFTIFASGTSVVMSVSKGGQTLTDLNYVPSANIVDTYTYNPYDGVRDFTGSSGRTVPFLDVTDTYDQEYTDAAMADFLGTGNVTFDVLGTGVASIRIQGSNVSGGWVGTGLADVTVSYEYVPEPATLGLLLLGAVSFFITRRRRSLLG